MIGTHTQEQPTSSYLPDLPQEAKPLSLPGAQTNHYSHATRQILSKQLVTHHPKAGLNPLVDAASLLSYYALGPGTHCDCPLSQPPRPLCSRRNFRLGSIAVRQTTVAVRPIAVLQRPRPSCSRADIPPTREPHVSTSLSTLS